MMMRSREEERPALTHTRQHHETETRQTDAHGDTRRHTHAHVHAHSVVL